MVRMHAVTTCSGPHSARIATVLTGMVSPTQQTVLDVSALLPFKSEHEHRVMGFKALSAASPGRPNVLPADAIAILSGSHRRQEEELGVCARALAQLVAGRGGPQQIATIAGAMAFFREKAARHVADEEESIFPRLSMRHEQQALVVDLETEHREHAMMLADMDAMLEAWGANVPSIEQASQFASQFATFADTYRAHIAREDEELLPEMRQLGATELTEIALEMVARRPKGRDNPDRMRHRGSRRFGRGKRSRGTGFDR